METFDFVIVGGGSAASVLAARLSEDLRTTVCVLEAGPADTNPWIRMPAGFVKTLFDPSVTWQFSSEPGEGTAGRRVPIAQGRTLGGSSSVNGAVINRGQAEDFDDWAQMGNRGWSYADVLPYFRRFERRIGAGDDRFRGREGPLPVTTPTLPNEACDAFIAAAQANGFPYNPDYNGEQQEGVGRYQSAIVHGRRVSAAKAFLHPAAKRANTKVITQALVTRVLLDGNKATGVEVRIGDEAGARTIRARQAVVVAAGALNSPKVLQLSGLGPADVLAAAGIAAVRDMPGVGHNLQDHYNARLVARGRKATFSLNSRITGVALAAEFVKWLVGAKSVLGLSPAMLHLFGKTRPALDRPNFCLIFMPASMKQGFIGRLDDFPGYTCGGWSMRPESRGSVSVASADPSAAPVIQPNYLSAEADRIVTVAALRVARMLLSAPEMAGVVAEEAFPGPSVQTDDEWLGFARQYGGTSYHFSGTCKMGPATDPAAVVDDRLRVHGIDGLLVVDASVMPREVSANTYAATLMIAEKAADMILGKPAPSR